MSINSKITVSFDVDANKSFSQTEMHNYRETDNHSNKSIDPSLSRFNSVLNPSDLGVKSADELLENHWGKFIQDHDFKCKKSRHLKDMYHNVDGYAESQKKPLTMRGVITLGDMNFKNSLLDEMQSEHPDHSREAIYHDYSVIMKALYTRYINRLNAGSSALKITRAVVHVDEGGAPHAHVEMVPLGLTPKGKPSHTLNNAISSTLPSSMVTQDTRENLRHWRKSVDSALISDFNSIIRTDAFKNDNKGLGYNIHALKLKRTGVGGGKTMEQYKEQKRLDTAMESIVEGSQVAQLVQSSVADSIKSSLMSSASSAQSSAESSIKSSLAESASSAQSFFKSSLAESASSAQSVAMSNIDSSASVRAFSLSAWDSSLSARETSLSDLIDSTRIQFDFIQDLTSKKLEDITSSEAQQLKAFSHSSNPFQTALNSVSTSSDSFQFNSPISKMLDEEGFYGSGVDLNKSSSLDRDPK